MNVKNNSEEDIPLHYLKIISYYKYAYINP